MCITLECDRYPFGLREWAIDDKPLALPRRLSIIGRLYKLYVRRQSWDGIIPNSSSTVDISAQALSPVISKSINVAYSYECYCVLKLMSISLPLHEITWWEERVAREKLFKNWEVVGSNCLRFDTRLIEKSAREGLIRQGWEERPVRA